MLDHIKNPEDLRSIISWGFGIIGTLIALGFYSIRWFFLREFEKHEKNFSILSAALKEFMAECHRCQIETLKNFVSKEDYVQLLGMRSEAHKIINNRLGALEIGQAKIADKLDTFHQDMQEKHSRLSKTFVLREAAISSRLDMISDRIGIDRIVGEKEAAMAIEIEKEINST